MKYNDIINQIYSLTYFEGELPKESTDINIFDLLQVDVEHISDGSHTFEELYYQRMMLFSLVVKLFKDKAWKSKRHEDGELCFGGGWFVVGIDTPEGSYTYHYNMKYWNVFDCKELECGKHWDGHTDKDISRLFSLLEEINL